LRIFTRETLVFSYFRVKVHNRGCQWAESITGTCLYFRVCKHIKIQLTRLDYT